MDDESVTGETASTIWPLDLFQQVIEQAKQTQAGPFNIDIPSEVEDFKNWRVAGIRVNPASLGGHEDILRVAPEIPGVRLVVQPVTVADGRVRIHDVAAHVVFNYLLPPIDTDSKPFRPDRETFSRIIDDLKNIKEMCESNQVKTSGELNIHPGFTRNVPGFKKALSDFVKKHCRRANLQVVSFMGLDGGFEPWVFFSMIRQPDSAFGIRKIGGFKGDLNVTGQALNFRGGDKVVPAPSADPNTGVGLSMGLLFDDFQNSDLSNLAFPGSANQSLEQIRIKHVPDLIANPTKMNTITTDCVSCHTETTRRFDLQIEASSPGISFKIPEGISGVADELLPRDRWNVRNFGWGLNFFDGNQFVPTVTVRSANEAAESADFINRVYLTPAEQ